MNEQVKVEPQGPLFWIIELAVLIVGCSLSTVGGSVGGSGMFIALGSVTMFSLFLGPDIHQWLVRKALKGAK